MNSKEGNSVKDYPLPSPFSPFRFPMDPGGMPDSPMKLYPFTPRDTNWNPEFVSPTLSPNGDFFPLNTDGCPSPSNMLCTQAEKENTQNTQTTTVNNNLAFKPFVSLQSVEACVMALRKSSPYQ
ncbi:hypothetical protein GPJ56_007696 [Histomonas meleagridis]|uniref:uncharacterized protein n=1 Tax=Histomonas meleagridis TaxID=135588 RepID=UPI0035598A07|nr:hypothetical protein GPJ56_007696 [Histomonas meleagridis]KAH0805889.1 hypothetical protein GO595_001323 [Histomonas meleagridis]